MRITFLTQYYPPEVGAPQARLSELAELLAERGHAITVLTAMPSYPVGRIFPGYGGVLRREKMTGVQVVRSFILPAQSAAIIPRMASYLSFVASSAILGTLLLRRQDVLLVESPPLFLGLSAAWLAWVKRCRLVFNVSDLWPESAIRLGIVEKGSFAHWVTAWLERYCYRRAWLVTGQSRSILGDIASRFPKVATFHLSNGCDTSRFGRVKATTEARRLLDPEGGSFVVTYAGLHGLAQGLSQILDAAELLRDVADVRFALVGDGPEKAALVRLASERGLENVGFLDPIPAAQVPSLLASSDALLVTLKTYLPGAVPSKIYEAMASERPLILMAAGEGAEILQRERAGIVLDPGDVQGLAAAILSVKEHPEEFEGTCQRARKAAEERYDRRRIATEFATRIEAA